MFQKILASLLSVVLFTSVSQAAGPWRTLVALKKLPRLMGALGHIDRSLIRAEREGVGHPVIRPGAGTGLRAPIRLHYVPLPKRASKVQQSYVNYLRHKMARMGEDQRHYTALDKLAPWVAHEWAFKGMSRISYDNPTQLAHDLSKFYKDDAPVFKGANGHLVKLYALPVDGLLCKPNEYAAPIVLLAEEYFVIHDLQTDTGRIEENIPAVYNSFKPYTEPDAAQELAQNANFTTYFYHKNAYAEDRKLDRWREVWRTYSFPTTFDSELDLGRTLYAFGMTVSTKARKKGQTTWGYLLEIPLNGLAYVDAKGELVEIDADKQVYWYASAHEGGLINRSAVEDTDLFEAVE